MSIKLKDTIYDLINNSDKLDGKDSSAFSLTTHTHSEYLTSHQSIYNLTFNAGKFTTTKTYDPNSSSQTVNIPTHTSHLINDSGFVTSVSGNYLPLTGGTLTGPLTLSNLTGTLKIGSSSFNYSESLVYIKAVDSGHGYSLTIERDNTDQQALIGFPCKTANSGGDSIYFGVSKNSNGALCSTVVGNSSQRSACGLKIDGHGSQIKESYISYYINNTGTDIYKASTGYSSLFDNAAGAFLLNGTNDKYLVLDDGGELKTNSIIRSLVDFNDSDIEHKCSAKFLTYPSSPFGIIIRSYKSGMQTIQSQRESNNSETFPLILNPFGGYVGINNASPKCSLDVGIGWGRARWLYFSDTAGSEEAGFVGRGGNDNSIYLGSYGTNEIRITNQNAFIKMESKGVLVSDSLDKSPRTTLDVYGTSASLIIGKTAGTPGDPSARKFRLGLGTAGHTGSEYWCFSIDDTTSNSYLQIGYDYNSTAMSVRHDGLVDVNSLSIGGQVITFVT